MGKSWVLRCEQWAGPWAMYQLRVQVQATLAEDPGPKELQGLRLEGPRPQDVLLGHSVSLKIYIYIYMYM